MNCGMQLILGTSCHLPNGSGEEKFERLYERDIKPLISAVYQFPKINITIHYSGVLLHWIERRHSEFIMLLEELLSRKQAELLGGGFYEPLLPLLPQSDKLGQIEMLTTYLRKQFGRRPQGCWIPALAWEQNLAGPLNACGMAYTFLEDFRFAAAEAQPAKAGSVYAPCVTEDQGKLITVFPIAMDLSKNFYSAKTIRSFDQSMGETANYPLCVFPRLIFAENPEQEYLRFFEELSKTSVEFTLPGRIHKNLKSLKKLYLCGAGNNSDASRPRQFLTERPEANGIYAKMVHCRTFINQLRGDKTRKRTALEELWKAQDPCFLASGEESCGIHNSSLRKAAYRALLEAEKITREKKKFTPSLLVLDFDLDGEGEYLFQDDKVNAYIKAEGAGLFELDYLPASWNYLDVFVPDDLPGPSKNILTVYRSFTDFLVPGGGSENHASNPDTRFCGTEVFEIQEEDRVRRKVGFRLAPKDGPLGKIEIIKTWQMKKNLISVRYALKNTGNAAELFHLVPRIGLSFPGDTEEDLRIFALRSGTKSSAAAGAVMNDLNGLEFQDIKNETLLVLESNRPFSAAIASVMSHGLYQFTEILPRLTVTLEAGKTWETDFSLRISS